MTSPTNEQQRVDVLAVLADAALTLSKVAQIQMDERAEEMRQARVAVAELIEKSTQTIAAFESLGNAKSMIANLEARRECENALVAQKTALANVGAQA